MDKRSLLLGLGIGIIIGALLMQLFLMGEQSSKQLTEIDNVINGVENNSPSTTDIPQVNAVAPEVNDNDKNIVSETTPVEADAATTVPVSELENNNNYNKGEYSTEEHFPTTVLLRVYTGATVTETAEVMFKHGIISDADSFVQYTRKMKKRIRAGYFLIDKGSTDEQILNKLTSEPLTEENAIEIARIEQYNTIFSPER